MPNETDDFWPASLGVTSQQIVAPATLLRQQARLLYDKTRGMLGAEVETVAREHTLHHVFVIVVPALEKLPIFSFQDPS